MNQADTLLTEQPFVIGTTPDGEKWWTNQAVSAVNGSLTDQRLLEMTDDELIRLAYNAEGEVRTELYKRPSDKGVKDRQGGEPGTDYVGVHRAKLILDYRDEVKRQSSI